MRIIITDRGDASVGLFQQTWEVDCPFSSHDVGEQQLNEFISDACSMYLGYCNGRMDVSVVNDADQISNLTWEELQNNYDIREKQKFLSLTSMSSTIHRDNLVKGFGVEEVPVGTQLMLIVSELSEALEALRHDSRARLFKFLETDKTPEDFKKFVKDTFEDEVADAIIRLLDMSGRLQIDIGNHVYYKMMYNRSRPYLHGKKF